MHILYTISLFLSRGIFTNEKVFSAPVRQVSRTFFRLRHTMIVETGSPLHYFIIRRHTMNNCLCNVFDNNNWIWIVLIVLLFSCCCGGC